MIFVSLGVGYNENSVVQSLDMTGNKKLAISQMVNVLKKVQAIQIDDPFSVSVVHNTTIIGEHTHVDSEIEHVIFSESRYINDIPQSGEIYYKAIKNSFSTYVEIDDFLQEPLFGEINQNTFEYLDQFNRQSFKSDTKFISTTTCYPQQPSCQLVSSAIHETIFLTNISRRDRLEKHGETSTESIVTPIHTSKKIGKSKYINDANDYIKIRVPVVLGEYKIELCIEEEILFEEKVIRIKEVTNNIVLTNCHFIPTEFSKSLEDGTCAVLSGMLAIEGHIEQNIKYSAMPSKKSRTRKRRKMMKLHEKIAMELIIQLLQEQAIHVNFNNLKHF